MRWLQPDRPFAPRRVPFFYGWVIVGVSTLGIAMSIPGQTMGVSVFTDHLMAATGLTRLQLANVYLVGTFASGLMLPAGGRLLDRFGVRATGLAATTALALTLVFLSEVDRVAGVVVRLVPAVSATAAAAVLVAIGFTLLRFSGQGMLTMCSRMMLGKWWDRWRGRISGLSGVFISFSFASAPILLHAWIEAATWRGAWVQMALVVGLGMGGVVLLFYRDTPEECGLEMDGGLGAPARASVPAVSVASEREPTRAFTRSQALRTLPFWAVTLALSNQSMVFTGVTFHIVDIGVENGVAAAAAVRIFLPVAVVSTCLGLLVGWAADRYPMRWLLFAMATAQAAGFAAIGQLGDPGWRLLAIAGWGGAGSFFGPLSVAALPMYFGRAHLGAIASMQMMFLVIASAVGPSLLAVSRQALGSYVPALYACCVLPLLVIALALRMRDPEPPT